MSRTVPLEFVLAVICTAPLEAAVTFDWAIVGNRGNADSIDDLGGVDYGYRISKYEVTNAQYIEFLHAVATVGDAYGLYNTSMAFAFGGIGREGAGTVGDPYVYSVKGGDINWLSRPVNYVSWGDSARFTNWLHNGQPTGSQDSTTTEDGAYYLNGATSNVALLAVSRELDAAYFIPSADEWYKAAHHKNDGVTGNYFDYPTSSDTVPGHVNGSGNLSGTGNPFVEGGTDPGNYATYDGDGGANVNGIGSPYYMTKIGEWENSASPYGTFDQGGNVFEWNEEVVLHWRIVRGGSFNNIGAFLRADGRGNPVATDEVKNLGFRVASLPEPGTALLGALAAGGLFMLRRRV